MKIELPSELSAQALAVRENAAARFSKFKVGAALRTRGGRIFRGCNVENATYGLTVCAERVALFTAIAEGERQFDAIVVATQSEKPSSPCGPCRQLLWEFCGDIDVFLINLEGETLHFKLSELFPQPFNFELSE
jgi:cytidine deaminase